MFINAAIKTVTQHKGFSEINQLRHGFAVPLSMAFKDILSTGWRQQILFVPACMTKIAQAS